MFIAGDDQDAKATVAQVVMDFGWPPPFDVGGIEGARLLESLCLLWVAVGAGRGAFDHGFKLLTG
jgi:predicted dinucleotide-binding enzyme